MTTAKKGIGDQEMALLRHVSEQPQGITVGEAAESFGGVRGLARSTVLTMMERLRQKGYLDRGSEGGAFRYTATSSQGDLLRGAVETFVERTLAGSVSPFVNYLSERGEVSASELAELEALVETLQAKRKEEP
jgi:predicted transcriptional regulator